MFNAPLFASVSFESTGKYMTMGVLPPPDGRHPVEFGDMACLAAYRIDTPRACLGEGDLEAAGLQPGMPELGGGLAFTSSYLEEKNREPWDTYVVLSDDQRRTLLTLLARDGQTGIGDTLGFSQSQVSKCLKAINEGDGMVPRRFAERLIALIKGGPVDLGERRRQKHAPKETWVAFPDDQKENFLSLIARYGQDRTAKALGCSQSRVSKCLKAINEGDGMIPPWIAERLIALTKGEPVDLGEKRQHRSARNETWVAFPDDQKENLLSFIARYGQDRIANVLGCSQSQVGLCLNAIIEGDGKLPPRFAEGILALLEIEQIMTKQAHDYRVLDLSMMEW